MVRVKRTYGASKKNIWCEDLSTVYGKVDCQGMEEIAEKEQKVREKKHQLDTCSFLCYGSTKGECYERQPIFRGKE